MKYTLSNLRKIVENPSLLHKAVRLVRKDLNQWCLEIDRRWYVWRYGFPDINPFQGEWDNFIIIDAARPDILREVIDKPEEVENAKSPVSDSGGFIRKCLNPKEFHDTVYVTANPHTDVDLDDEVFHAVVNLLDEDWDPQNETVLPEVVRERTIEARHQFSDKRLVVHFMQPHFPFIGPKGADIDAGIGQTLASRTSPHPWNEQMWGNAADRDALIGAYRENHAIVFDEVEKLLEELDGKSIITADHANMIGERAYPIPIRIYGHPRDFPHPNLTTVPRITRGGNPRKVTAEPPIQRAIMDETTVENRLDALGYQ